MTGSLTGKFEAFEKLSKLHAKNDFSLAIILGDLFADPTTASAEDENSLSSLLNGTITIPLPTYFTLGKYPLPPRVQARLEGGEDVCGDLYFLGKRSTTRTSEGIRIVALGGQLDAELTALSKDKFLPVHTEGDAKALHGANNADILITTNWPSSIRSHSNVKLLEGTDDPISEQCVAELCSVLKPRYHFSASDGFFYEREPFFHLTTDGTPDTSSLTRFLSLAAFDNSAKQKWLYAFSIDPDAAQSGALPAGSTATPFNPSRKRKALPNQGESFSRFAGASHSHDNHHRGSKRRKAPPPGPGECFFCLSNPNLATHLITSIGNDAYLTTAKGPLSDATTYPGLSFPAHMLIIPLSHSPTLASITPADTRLRTYQEMRRYRLALQDMLSSQTSGRTGAVTWEVSRVEGIHIHWQFLPVSTDLVRKGLVEAAFKVEAENEKYPVFEHKEIDDGASQEGGYFRIWIWSPKSDHDDNKQREEHKRQLVLPLSADFRFDLQFGRRVMAKLLGLEKRLQWRDCLQSDDEETKDAESFKQAFQAFDFSLKDDVIPDTTTVQAGQT